MNDFWNDPPEDDCAVDVDCPECGSGDICPLTGNELIVMMGCEECGGRWFERIDIHGMLVCGVDLGGDDDLTIDFEAVAPSVPEECPHGLPWGDCNDCMVAGDLAYDAARERWRA